MYTQMDGLESCLGIKLENNKTRTETAGPCSAAGGEGEMGELGGHWPRIQSPIRTFHV